MKILWFTALLAGSGILQAQAPTQTREPADSVRIVAQRELPNFLKMIPPGQEGRYGFLDRDQFARAQAGIPLPVLAVPGWLSDSLTAPDSAIADRPADTLHWRVPVVVDGQVWSLLTVERMAGVWQVVEIGGAALGREIHAIELRHGQARRALLRLDRLRCDVLVLDSSGRDPRKARFLPLESYRKAFPSDTLGERSRREMFRSLRKSLQGRPRTSWATPTATEVTP